MSEIAAGGRRKYVVESIYDALSPDALQELNDYLSTVNPLMLPIQQVLGFSGFAAAAIDTRYRKTTEKDVTNTTTETDLLNGEITVAAGAMATNKILRATLGGDYLLNVAGTSAFAVKLGGTVLWKDTVGAIGAVATRRPWRLCFEIANLSAFNSQFVTGRFSFGEPVAATTGLGNIGVDVATATDAIEATFSTSGTASVDTSAAVALEVTVTHTVASASLSARLKYALVEIL